MTNLEALRAQCKLICNTCYVDTDVLEYSLINEGIFPNVEIETVNDSRLIRLAIVIVMGWVQTSGSENGVSKSIDLEAVRRNVRLWCDKAGLDASEFLTDISVIEDGSNLW